MADETTPTTGGGKVSPTKTEAAEADPIVREPIAGEPDASYVSPDLSFQDGVGELPDEEKKWHKERDDARAAEVKAAEESDKKAVEGRKQAKKDEEKAAKEAATA